MKPHLPIHNPVAPVMVCVRIQCSVSISSRAGWVLSVSHVASRPVYATIIRARWSALKPRLHVPNRFTLKRFEAVQIAFTRNYLNRFPCKRIAVCKTIYVTTMLCSNWNTEARNGTKKPRIEEKAP